MSQMQVVWNREIFSLSKYDFLLADIHAIQIFFLSKPVEFLYDFVLISSEPYKGAYYHHMLMKEHPALCKLMLRSKIKGQATTNLVDARQR
jgi:hypothetical protein